MALPVPNLRNHFTRTDGIADTLAQDRLRRPVRGVMVGQPARAAAPALELFSHHLLEHLLVETQVGDQPLQALVLLLELLQALRLGGHQPAILLAPSVIRLHADRRLPAHLLDPRPFLRLAQDERDLLLAEL